MADIFISYTHEDLSAARRLRGALMREGWSVWWDESLQAGRNFNDAIEAALRRARCAIVLWSRRSLASEYVRQEAGLALHLQRLLPVAIERLDLQADLPLPFRDLHTLALFAWDGKSHAEQFGELVAQIRTLAGEPRHIGADPGESVEAQHERALAKLRTMADYYLTLSAPDWAERVRLKDQCGRDMVEFMDDAGIVKADLLGESHEGLILAMAWKIQSAPSPEDLFSLLDAAKQTGRLHVRYRLVLAIVSLHDAGMVPSTAIPMIRQVLSAYRADADEPLLVRLDQLDLSLTLRGGR